MDKFLPRLSDADYTKAQAEYLTEFRAQVPADLDRDALQARAEPLSGEQLRRRIDALGVPYVRMAMWLGLSVEGLHKQMRGDRAVSVQTTLLFSAIEALLKFTEETAQAIASDTNRRGWDKRLDVLVARFKRRTALTNISGSGWVSRRARLRAGAEPVKGPKKPFDPESVAFEMTKLQAKIETSVKLSRG